MLSIAKQRPLNATASLSGRLLALRVWGVSACAVGNSAMVASCRYAASTGGTSAVRPRQRSNQKGQATKTRLIRDASNVALRVDPKLPAGTLRSHDVLKKSAVRRHLTELSRKQEDIDSQLDEQSARIAVRRLMQHHFRLNPLKEATPKAKQESKLFLLRSAEKSLAAASLEAPTVPLLNDDALAAAAVGVGGSRVVIDNGDATEGGLSLDRSRTEGGVALNDEEGEEENDFDDDDEEEEEEHGDRERRPTRSRSPLLGTGTKKRASN